MVICLKVKTLDSQTYDFTVDDEISVRQFKETIAEKTNISADLQRLIYCGRVLIDEKLLKEYDVNGKVVHVVERPPPSARITSSNTSENRRSRSDGLDGGIRGSPIFRALDGMVVGAMTIPVNASGEQANVPPLNPSSSFCMNRITVARHMLDCANNIASYLENPERGLNNSSLDILAQGRWTMESTVVEVGISATDNLDIPQNQRQNLVEALHGAVSAALRQNGHPNLTVVQLPTVFGSTGPAAVVSSQGANQTNGQNSSAAVTDSNASNDQSQQNTTNADLNPTENDSTETETETPNVTTNNTSQQEQRQGGGGGGTSTSNSSTNSPTRQRTGTRVLSEVINQMTTVQNRLAPFINQYNEILSNDPSFEENDTAGRENAQRIFDRVSEALHYMSHAQHAISDLMLDLSQPAPRYLCCRPILVEQSGFVSANNIASLFQSTGNNNYNNNNGETNGVNGGGANNASTTINISTSNDPPVPIFIRSSAPPPPQSGQSTTNGSSGTGGGGGSGSNNSDASNQLQSNNSGSNASVGVNQQQNINRGLHRILSPLLLPMPPTHSSLSSTSVTSNNSTTNDNANSISSSNTTNQEGQTIAEIVLNLSPRHILIPNPQLQVARLIQAVVNSAPLDADLHVQINAPNLLTFGLPSNQQQQQQTQPTQTSSQQTNASSNTSSTTNTTNNNESAGNQQNQQQQQQQQARVTTATHPTTSTQTRSTPRPQVHVANIPPSQMWNTRVIPANMVSSFDRFLPCSSHHIRENESHDNSQNASNVFVRSRAQGRQRRQQQQQQSQQRQPQNQQQVNSQQQTSTANRTASASSTSRNNNESNLSNESPIINILGNNVTIRDLMNFTPNPEILNRIRNNIHEFIVNNFFAGSPITEDNMNNAINNVIQLLHDALLFLPQFDLSDYDSRASVENFIRNSLPFIINLIREDNSNEFGIRLIREMIQFVRRLFVIIVTCVGRINAELYLNQIIQMAMNSGHIPGEEEALRTLQRQLLPAVLRELDTMLQNTTSQNTSDVQEFLVIRRPNIEQQQSQQRNDQVTPMETDDRENELEQNSSSELPISRIIAAANAAATAAANVAAVAANAAASAAVNVANNTTESTAGAASNELQRQQQQQQQQQLASLPRVNIGSEPWHNNFPSNWIPIITRDIEKQRRQSPQSPFSDAYISGMSAKRRKMVSNSKPPTDIQSLIKDGVRKAIQTVGNNTTTTASSSSSSSSALFNLIGGSNNSNNTNSNNDGHSIEEISTAISTDPVAQLSYRETLRTSIHERLETDSDFTPDKFPNSSKYFTK